jgi:hypothetical protein
MSRRLLALCLALATLSARHIVIYNEETIVVLCFFAFVLCVAHYYGQAIGESLQERGTAIQDALLGFAGVKGTAGQALLTQHRAVPGVAARSGAVTAGVAHLVTSSPRGPEGAVVRRLTGAVDQRAGLMAGILTGAGQEVPGELAGGMVRHALRLYRAGGSSLAARVSWASLGGRRPSGSGIRRS